MIFVGTRLQVIDNSGGKEIECIKLFGRSRSRVGYTGDIFLGSLKSVLPNKKVKKGDVVRAVIVTVKKALERSNGSAVSFGVNSAVLVSLKNIPIGSRLLGPVMLELREKGLLKVLSMSTVSV